MEVKKLLAMSQALWDRLEAVFYSDYGKAHQLNNESKVMRHALEVGLEVIESRMKRKR